MDRRALLASIGTVGVAGCLGGSNSTETPAPTPPDRPRTDVTEITPVTTTETESVDVGPFSEIRVEQPTELPFAFSVSLRAGEELPQLTVEVTNEGERGYVLETLGHWGIPFTGDVSGDREGRSLVAGAVSRGEPRAADLDCTVGRIAVQPSPERVELTPEESVTESGPVANHVENTVCWPEGEHRFSQGYKAWSADDAFRFTFEFGLVI